MKIYGLDFSSAPSNKKPITCAEGFFDGNCLHIEQLIPMTSFLKFEQQLNTPGPWVMAIDFPFSMPQRWITDMQWPKSWKAYVQQFNLMDMETFVAHIKDYEAKQPKGQKQHFRAVDKLANSCSPMKVDFTPVGRMFFRGAHRVLNSGANIPILRPNDSDRTVLEGYPALVARCFIQRQSYKSDDKKKQTDILRQARQTLVEGLLSDKLKQIYGFQLNLSSISISTLIDEPGADQLDAILCAIQAAWSYSRNETDSGFPRHAHNSQEGWIPDPSLLEIVI